MRITLIDILFSFIFLTIALVLFCAVHEEYQKNKALEKCLAAGWSEVDGGLDGWYYINKQSANPVKRVEDL